MNKKIGKIIILLIIISIVVIVVQYLINMDTIYLGNNTKLFLLGSKIIKINNNAAIKLRKVNIYKNGNTLKGYIKSDKTDSGYEYYLISKNNRVISSDDLIVSGSFIKLDNVSPSNITNIIDNSLLKELNNSLGSYLTLDNIIEYKKISYDIDKDSDIENVVFVNYLVNNDYTTRIFLEDDDEIVNVLEYEYDYSNMENSKQVMYSLTGLIDFNKDKNYEIVISKIDGNSQPTYYEIYSYENGSIKEIK